MKGGTRFFQESLIVLSKSGTPPPTYYSKTQPNETFVVLFWISFLYRIRPLEDAGGNKAYTMTRQFKPECTATGVIATG